MTEYELFRLHIPQIAEMVVKTQRMDDAAYNAWKQECLEAAPAEPVKQFIKKVLTTIDIYRQEKGGASCEET